MSDYEKPRNNFKPMPDEVIRRNGGVRCDMLVGPCACGAWHSEDEAEKFISEQKKIAKR